MDSPLIAPAKSPLIQDAGWGGNNRKDARKSDKVALQRKVLELLQEKPEGMCGGLITQKLKASDFDLIAKAYSNGKEIQRGWLQDVMRKLPEVEHNPMGRDTWYKCSEAHIREYDSGAHMSPQRSTGSSSMSGSPGCRSADNRSPYSSPDRIKMDSPAKTDLANAVQDLLLEAPGGLSMPPLGLRLRRSDPRIVDNFLLEAGACGPGESKPALEDLIQSIPGVQMKEKGGSEFYSIEKTLLSPSSSKGSFSGLFGAGGSPPPASGAKRKTTRGQSPLEELIEIFKAFFQRFCNKRSANGKHGPF